MNQKIEKIYSLTGLQEGMYFDFLKEGASTNYHLQNVFTIEGVYGEDQIVSALEVLSQRFGVFRTNFVLPSSSGIPRQVVLANRTIPLKVWDMRSVDEGHFEDEIKKFLKRDLGERFNLEKGCLFRVNAFSRDNFTTFAMSFHHCIMDGWSFMRVVEIFLTLLTTPDLALFPSAKTGISQPDFGDYVVYLENLDKKAAYDFWKSYLNGYQSDSSKSQILPYKKKETKHVNDAACVRGIGSKCTAMLNSYALKSGCTLSTVAQVMWGFILQCYTASNDVLFARIISGREQAFEGIGDVVGLVANSVPCRISLLEDDLFFDSCKDVFERDIAVSKFQYLSLSDIFNASGLDSSVIGSVMAFENYADSRREHKGISFDYAREQVGYPLSIKYYIKDGELVFEVSFDPEQFKSRIVEVLADNLKNAFVFVANNPTASIGEIETLDDFSAKIIAPVGDLTSFDESLTIVDCISKNVIAFPDKDAVSFKGKSVSYRNLWDRSHKVAIALRNSEISRGDSVLLVAEQGIDYVVSLIGILLVGACCVPVDLQCSEERMRDFVEQTDAKLVVTTATLLNVELPQITINEDFFDGNDSVEWATRPFCALPGDIALVLFTSGTTGTPKGVRITHGNIISRALGSDVQVLGFSSELVMAQYCSLLFDASVFEITSALIHGGKLAIVETDMFLDAAYAKKVIREESINTMILPTAVFNQVTEYGIEIFDDVSMVLFGGEAVNAKAVKKLLGYNKNVVAVNLYGPTETSAYVTCRMFFRDNDTFDIGFPVPTAKVSILRGARPCSVGMIGELSVSGPQVADGYTYNGNSEEQRFCRNTITGERTYRTGDYARWKLDGSIEYLGRMDHQVKYHGYRIELREIELAMESVRGVKTAIADMRCDAQGDKCLLCFYSSDSPLEKSILRSSLQSILPHYMIPQSFVWVEDFKKTRNGKIDRSTLPEPIIDESENYIAPKTRMQSKMCACVEETLGISRVGIQDNLFDLGCDSLKAMKLLKSMQRAGFDFNITDFFRFSTVEKLSQQVLQKREIEVADCYHASQGLTTFVDVKEYLDEEIKKYQDLFVNHRDVDKVPLMANQRRVFRKMSIMSGMVVQFDGEFNFDHLNRSFLHLVNTQSAMRATYRNDLIIFKSRFKEISLPYLNLKNADESLKNEVRDYLAGEFFEDRSRADDTEYCLHKAVAVKYSQDDCRIYLPVDHIIFDAMSGQIIDREIKQAYYNIDSVVSTEHSYKEYLMQIARGPQRVTQTDLMDILRISDFVSAMAQLAKQDTGDYENYYFSLQLGRPSEDISKEALWDISYDLFLCMLGQIYNLDVFPFILLFVNRKYEDNDYFDSVGLFIDALPSVGRFEEGFQYKNITDRIAWLSTHNVNALTMISSTGSLKRYPKIAKDILGIYKDIPLLPVFNYLGLYESANNINDDMNIREMLAKETVVTRTVDVKVRQSSLSFLAYGRRGHGEDMGHSLQERLDWLLKRYGY